MRRSASVLLFLFVFACSASATRHEVHLQVLSVLSQTVRGVGVGGPVGGEFTTQVPCSRLYPSDTVSGISGPGSLDRCVLANPAHQATVSVQNRRVEAILTTEDGQTYYVVLGCQKQYGWCAPLADRANYWGKLDDRPKWLADYQHRPFYGFIKVSLCPDGKKKVTYQIEYATKMKTLRAGD
jgi:hypothetical protein